MTCELARTRSPQARCPSRLLTAGAFVIASEPRQPAAAVPHCPGAALSAAPNGLICRPCGDGARQRRDANIRRSVTVWVFGPWGRSRCVAAAPWAGWPPDRVAAAKISTALDTLVGTNEALAASSPVDSGGHGRAHAAAMLAERQGAGIGGLDPGWCYADDRLRTLLWAPCFRRKKV